MLNIGEVSRSAHALSYIRSKHPDAELALVGVHSNARGDRGLLAPSEIVDIAVANSIHTLLVTGKTSEAARRAQAYAVTKEKPINVPVAYQVVTQSGMRLIFATEKSEYLRRDIVDGQHITDLVHVARERQGVTILRAPLTEHNRGEIIEMLRAGVAPDAIEAVTGSPLRWMSPEDRRFHRRVMRDFIHGRGKVAEIGVSGAQGAELVRAVTVFEADSSLIDSVRDKKTKGIRIGDQSPLAVTLADLRDRLVVATGGTVFLGQEHKDNKNTPQDPLVA